MHPKAIFNQIVGCKNKNILKFLDYSILCLVEGDKNANEKAN